MPEILLAEDFLVKAQTTPIIDVRTPKEYEQGHIHGAFNTPIFSNKERAVVGTLYKQRGKETAVLQGLDYVSVNMSSFVKNARKIAVNNELLIYCWRGGMRSASMAWLFETVGIKCYTLSGGYKGYRNYIRQAFSHEAKIIILGGLTGSGKSDILHELKKLGEQVLDLEKHANHKGSAFGGLGQDDQPGNEQFENDIYNNWQSFDFEKPLWIEDESQHIGRAWVPDPLYLKIRNSTVIKIEIPMISRIERLVKEYSCFDKSLLEENINKIGKRLGGQHVKQALESLQAGDYHKVAEIVLGYYDKAYNFGLSKRNQETIYTKVFQKDDPLEAATELIGFSKIL